MFLVFFFQAEDGIRDIGVTGVQTCALPIFIPASVIKRAAARVLERRTSVPRPLLGVRGEAIASTTLKQLETTGWKMEEARSEERRGGKEGRSRWSPHH